MTDTIINKEEPTPTAESSADPEYVDIHEASDEDLDAELKRIASNQASEEEDLEEPVETEPEAPEETKQEASPQKSQKKEAQKEQSEAPPPNETERLKKIVRDKELFIQKQATELGKLRKLEKERIAELQKKLTPEAFLETPDAAIDAKLGIREAEGKIQSYDEAEKRLQAHRVISANVESSPELPQAMLEALQRDGMSPEFLSRFAQDPIGSATPGELIQLAKRAKAESIIRELLTHIDELHGQLQSANDKPGRMMDKIERAFSQPPRVNGASGQARTPAQTSHKQLALMSDAELAQYEKEILGA